MEYQFTTCIENNKIDSSKNDLSNESISQQFDLDVSDQQPDPPSVIANPGDQTVKEDDNFIFELDRFFSEIDPGDTLTYDATLSNGGSLPNWLSINHETGVLTGTPDT